MYIANGRPLWYINKLGLTTIDADLDRLRGIDLRVKLKDYTAAFVWSMLVFCGLGLWGLISGISTLAGLILIGLGLLFSASIVVPHILERRFYRRLLTERRVIELDSMVGKGLRKFLFAGDRDLEPQTQLLVLERACKPLIYTVSQHPLDKFLQDADVWSALWDLAVVSTPDQQARLVAALEPHAEALLQELQPYIIELQRDHRKLVRTKAKLDTYMVNHAIERLSVKSAARSDRKVSTTKPTQVG